MRSRRAFLPDRTLPVSDPDVSRPRLIRDARFLEADRREIALLRGRHNRLGFAYQAPSCVGLRLEQLLAHALPTSGAVALSGSMLLGRSSKLPPFVLHVKPAGDSQPDYGALPVAALVLIVEPGQHHRIDPDLVARTLRLTPAESQVAVSLAEGKNVREIARTTGLTEGAIYWHLKQIY